MSSFFQESRPSTAAGKRPSTRNSEARPHTRQASAMSYQRDPLSRPTTSGRPVTSRPLSSALRGAPSTASRLISTASGQRPQTTRSGLATGIGLSTPINVVERPITQQGLTGIKTGMRGQERQVQDKGYYFGLLRAKASDLTAEIVRINSELESIKHEHSSYLTYDKRVKEVASELTKLQGNLSDHNMLIDFLNTSTDLGEINEEYQSIQKDNNEKSNELENLFGQKQDIELKMRHKENALAEERQMGESMIEAMNPELRDKYLELRNLNTNYLHHLDQMQQEIDTFDGQKRMLEDEVSSSRTKEEAVALNMKLMEVREQKQAILDERDKRGTPKEESERLFEQVKDDNVEIATMERQIGEMQEEVSGFQEELEQLEMQLEDCQSERNTKYRELRKREDAMEQFLDTFEANKEEEIKKLAVLEENIVSLLNKIALNATHMEHLPSTQQYGEMNSDLNFKKGELDKSRFTQQSLKTEHTNLQANLVKIDILETKLEKEKTDIREKLEKMSKDLIELNDIDGFKAKMETTREILIKQKYTLDERKSEVNQSIKDNEASVGIIKKQLDENESFGHLQSLEKKWANLEQANFQLRESIVQKRSDSNFSSLKSEAFSLTSNYNRRLQQVLHENGSIP